MNTPHSAKNVICQNPRQPGFVQNPYALYQRIHESGLPVYWKDYGFWCIAEFDIVNNVFRDKRFARLPPPGYEMPSMAAHLSDFSAVERHSLLSLEPPEHTRLRRWVNHAFISRQVNSMTATVESLAHQCIDRFQAQGKCDLLKTYATPIPVAVITQLLGIENHHGEQLTAWSHDMVRVYTMTQSHDEETSANEAARAFKEFILKALQDKRRKPENDLLSHLSLPRNDDRLSDAEIVSVAILLLNAGHEATVHQLGNAVATLLMHYPLERRGVLLDLLKDDDRTDALVTECLRFAGPLHLFTRYAQEAIPIADGITLKKGDTLGLLLGAANRCPLRFSNPNEFHPDRADGGHLSFGAGIHFCVGAQLARLELRIALQVLFKRLPTLALAHLPQYKDAFHFHGLAGLAVCWPT